MLLLNKQDESIDVAFMLKNEITTLSEKCYKWTMDGRVAIWIKIKGSFTECVLGKVRRRIG